MTMYPFDVLVSVAERLLGAAGLDEDKASEEAKLLVTADAMGHSTHGLAQLPGYLEEIENGDMTTTGEPEVLADRPSAVLWDGRRLPGLWLTAKALALASDRARANGLCAVTIRRSHHIACLAAFLPAAAERGLLAIIASSDPSSADVAPFGGKRPIYTPDPIAIGIPTDRDPILVDVSTSITTNGMSARLRRRGRRFPGPWAVDAAGKPTDDPSVLVATPRGSLLPIGGLDHGHKGYGLALAVEALTQGLSGYGRADGESRWGASVFIEVFDPDAFGGLAAFTRQTGWLATACADTPAIDPERPVRLPGAAAMAGLRAAKASGLPLHEGLMDALVPWAKKLGVPMPPVPAQAAEPTRQAGR
jgi:LDH2 family malate/lactate/ureidoglycolate dehydrogenase